MNSKQEIHMSNKEWSKKLLLAVAGVAILFYYIHNKQSEQAASARAAHDKQELEKAKAITVLPPGTEEAWNAYIDRRIPLMMQRRGSTVQLIDFMSKALNETTFVSVTSPYVITCDTIEGSIKFPQTATKYGDDIATVTLYIYLLGQDSRLLRDHSALNSSHGESASEKSAYINPDTSEEQPPPLGVNEESIAAEELRKHLCQRITDKVQAIFTQQPQTDMVR